MASKGLCLVISPLIALMKDQVENLRKKNITAFAIYSGMTRKEVINTLDLAANSNCKFLYVSPERLETKLFHEYLPALGISLVAVDESHCVSQWGYDFRPPYLRISNLREELPGIPVLALTASATPLVQKDICEKLSMDKPAIFRQSFARPNLSYSAFEENSKINKLLDILKKVPGTGIVYCRSRRKTKEISDLLVMHGIDADFYHAGLSSAERSQKQEDWIKNKIRVIVCTNAFGMGIDKPDVRIVVHVDVPDCLENYYQEAGRAGRDGNKSYAVLLYSEEELLDLRKNIDAKYPSQETIRQVLQYLVNEFQLPAGTGAGQSFDFDLQSFIRKYKLEAVSAVSSLKALEQEGLLGYSEQVFLSSRIQFVSGRERINELERTESELEPLVKILLRTYEGIFDQAVSINEKFIASLLKKDAAHVTAQLKVLHNSAIIEYTPQKDIPQVFFLTDRPVVAEFHVNMKHFNKRKELHIERVQKMIEFVRSSECRSTIIGEYFGDKDIKDCGVCDNCLKKKRNELSSEEFDRIGKSIKDILINGPVSADDLYASLGSIQKEKISTVLRFFQSENRIRLTKYGMVESVK